MDHESFEKIDASLMKQFKAAREKKAPPALINGFSASVERKIRETEQASFYQPRSRRNFVPLWAPVFAVLTIGFVIVSRVPFGVQRTAGVGYALSVPVSVSDISDEISEMRELGVWTDEDEKAIVGDVNTEVDTAELSRSGAL